jgi:hypothetical protein
MDTGSTTLITKISSFQTSEWQLNSSETLDIEHSTQLLLGFCGIFSAACFLRYLAAFIHRGRKDLLGLAMTGRDFIGQTVGNSE